MSNEKQYAQEQIVSSISEIRVEMMKVRNFLFLNSLLSKTLILIDESCPTACTDGMRIMIGPDFWFKLDKEERKFLIAHEVLHIAYMHVLRKQDKNVMKWNVACDYVINAFLIKSGFKMIEGGLYDKQYENLSSEEVYERLPENLNFSNMMQDLQDSLPGQKGKGADKLTPKQIAEVKRNIVAAAQLAELQKQAGSVPLEVGRYVNELLTPKIDWKDVFVNTLKNQEREDYTMARPNRRHISAGRYVSSMYSESLDEISVSLDTSGSVNEEDFKQFISEVSGIIANFRPKKIELTQFDCEMYGPDIVTDLHSLLNVQFKGGGGTDPAPVIEHYKNSTSKILVVITDGYFSFNFEDPRKPVVWLIVNGDKDFSPPFGRTIIVD